MVAVIAIIVFLALVGGGVFAVIKTLKMTDPNRMDTSTNDNITTAQEFLPFENIQDNMILLGGHRYRAVIECSSTNYNLKTDKEKELIELSFQRFLNSLTFPVTIFVQTRVYDNTKMLNLLEEEMKKSVQEFPQLQEYANIYYDEMLNLNNYIGNNKQKKKYIIVPYEDAVSMPNLTDEEKYEYSMKKLQTRVSLIIDGLSAVGVKARELNTHEIVELVYSTYHKDNYAQVEHVLNGEYLSLMVDSDNKNIETLSPDATMDWILYDTQMRLQTQLLGETVPPFIQENAQYCIQEINRLRDKVSGYYKQKSDDIDYKQKIKKEDYSQKNSTSVKK